MINYKIDNVVSTHSFNSYQVSVVEYLDREKVRKKGIAVAPIPGYFFEEATYSEAMGNFGKPLGLDTEEVRNFYSFISGVLSGKLPAKIVVNHQGPKLRISLNRFVENWHGGGAYKGRVGFGFFSALSFTNNAVVTKESLSMLQESLDSLYAKNLKAEASA